MPFWEMETLAGSLFDIKSVMFVLIAGISGRMNGCRSEGGIPRDEDKTSLIVTD